MQQMTPQACSGGNTTGKQLVDIRDGKSYWVAKLKDGKCWMTQNLDLDLTDITLTSLDSDISRTWTPNLLSELWSDTNTSAIHYYDPGIKYCNASGCNLTTSTNNGHDAQGNYYTWNAATAGTGSIVGASGNATSSICPKGWKLPTGDNNAGDFYGLLNGLDTATITASPYYFVSGGSVYASSLNDAGSGGYYWSSTASGASNAYYLRFSSSSVGPSSSFERYAGFSVRCVAK